MKSTKQDVEDNKTQRGQQHNMYRTTTHQTEDSIYMYQQQQSSTMQNNIHIC